MGVLALEPFLSPEDLLTADTQRRHRRWWALHTRPRAEKALARQLHALQIGFFLPLHERRRLHQRRLVRSFSPLFPGYVFMLGNEEERLQCLKTNLVVHPLEVLDHERERFVESLRHIHELMQSGAPLSPEERLQPGMLAEIVSGPLTGHRGKVVRSGNKLKFVIEVDFLQRGASVEIDSAMVRPA